MLPPRQSQSSNDQQGKNFTEVSQDNIGNKYRKCLSPIEAKGSSEMLFKINYTDPHLSKVQDLIS
jgi:hypothetical protein